MNNQNQNLLDMLVIFVIGVVIVTSSLIFFKYKVKPAATKAKDKAYNYVIEKAAEISTDLEKKKGR